MKNTVKNEVPYSQDIMIFEKDKLIHCWGNHLQPQAQFSLEIHNLLGQRSVRLMLWTQHCCVELPGKLLWG